MRLATHATLLKERVVESDAADKVKDVAHGARDVVCDGAGFAAWSFGRLLSPVTSRVKNAWKEYQEMSEE